MNSTLRREWPGVLAGLIAAMYLWIGAAAEDWDRLWGLGGGLAILVSLALSRRSVPLGLAVLALGALPLAVATWWSLVTPVLAVVVITLGLLSARALGRSRPVGDSDVETNGLPRVPAA